MKILQIIPQLSSGGAERFAVDLSNELAERGHEVVLVVLHSIEAHGFYEGQLSPKVRLLSMNKPPGFDLRLFFRLYSLISRERPNIIHTHLRAIVYALLAECFVVHGVHTVHSEASAEASEWFSRTVRHVLFRTRRVTPVTISPESQESFVRFYGMKDVPMIFNGRNVPERIEVSPAVAEEFRRYRHGTNQRVLVCLARIYEVKRQDMLARIAARLHDEGFCFTLLFIGSTISEKVKLEMERHAHPDVHILGERQNPLEYLSQADAYCLCSSYEGLPISLLEALGTGCVPVCTPVGGIPNIVSNGKNGFLSEDISEEAYYKTLRRFLSLDDETLRRFKAAAKASYSPYSMTGCAQKYLAIFQKNISSRCL
ncbi:MAG: glycosyltransferase [Bacteroidaceae bacterium]|nr:glycosyltransferase [Bacteroidaceae bacterium]